MRICCLQNVVTMDDCIRKTVRQIASSVACWQNRAKMLKQEMVDDVFLHADCAVL